MAGDWCKGLRRQLKYRRASNSVHFELPQQLQVLSMALVLPSLRRQSTAGRERWCVVWRVGDPDNSWGYCVIYGRHAGGALHGDFSTLSSILARAVFVFCRSD